MTAAYFALILRRFGRSATERAALLTGTGAAHPRDGDRGSGPSSTSAVESAPAAEITLGQQLRQVRNANRLLGPGWSLALGADCHAATHGPLGIGAVSAPTVRRGIEVMTRFSEIRAPHFRLLARPAASGELFLMPEERVDLAEEERRALLDIVLLSTQHMVAAIVGRPFGEARFELPGDGPAALHPRRRREYFRAPVRFGCARAAVVLPERWLDLECPLADPVLFEASLRSLELAERRFAGPGVLRARVEQIVASRRASDAYALDEVARRTRLSRRTLSRRLREQGASYRGLVDSRRRERAESLLRDRALGLAEIAYALGFADVANFGRACRRWFGMSPGRFRARIAPPG